MHDIQRPEVGVGAKVSAPGEIVDVGGVHRKLVGREVAAVGGDGVDLPASGQARQLQILTVGDRDDVEILGRTGIAVSGHGDTADDDVRLRYALALAGATVTVGGGAAIAAHVSAVDPATVPTGFLAAHNEIAEVPVAALARAAKPDGAQVSVQHARLGPNVATAWHTHPGVGMVTVVRGMLTYEDAGANTCRRTTYPAQGLRRSRLRTRSPRDRRP